MIKLVVFDWNGTIFADTYAIYESDNQICKLLKLKPVSFKTFQKYFDVPVKRFYLVLGVPEQELDKKALQIASTFHSYYEVRAAKTRTRANAKRLLNWLSKENIDSIIFSNHILESIKKQLKRLKINHFSEILANTKLEAAFKGRSKKEKLKNYMRKHKFLPAETLIIGDTIEEIEIARELGAFSVAIAHGNCSVVRLKAAKPDYLIYNLRSVIDIIKGLNSL